MNEAVISVFCSVCGVPVRHQLIEAAEPWISQLRFIFIHDTELDASGKSVSGVPYLSQKGRICSEYTQPEPEILDVATNSYIQRNFTIYRNWEEMPANEQVVYPLHEACWNILYTILSHDSPSQPTIRERMSTLSQILHNKAYVGYELLWPHGNHGVPLQEDFHWDPTKHPFASCDPWDIRDFQNMNADSHADPVGDEVPVILPLPLELVYAVYFFLDLRDIASIRKAVRSNADVTTARIPETYWESVLKPKAEYGYLCLNGLRKSFPDFSWYQMFLLARHSHLPNGLKNRHLIWKICKELSDQVIDIADSQKATGTPFDRTDPQFELFETAGYTPSDNVPDTFLEAVAEYSHACDSTRGPFIGVEPLYQEAFTVEATNKILLSYSGSGSLLFLCGMIFLPGKEQLGYITKHTRLISLDPQITSYLAIAVSQFGIKDISISGFPASNNATWRLKSEDFESSDIAIKRRILGSTTKDSRCLQVYGEWDASKLTKLRISSSEMLTKPDIETSEALQQRYAWTPNYPHNEHTVSYDSLCGIRLHLIMQWSMETFNPMRQITFPQAPMTRITGFTTGVARQISGLVFHFDSVETPELVLGAKIGASVAFPVDGANGESVYSVSTMLDSANCLNGIIFETTFKRKGVFTGSTSDYLGKRISWEVSTWRPLDSDSKVVGIFGTLDSRQTLIINLPNIGVIHSGQIECTRVAGINITNLFPEMDTAVDIPYIVTDALAPLSASVSIRSLNAGHFSSKASLFGCTKIICYLRRKPETRVTGLQLVYRPGFTKGDSSQILGQIYDSNPEPNILELGKEKTVSSIEVFFRKSRANRQSLAHSPAAVGMVITISDGSSVRWGEFGFCTEIRVLGDLESNCTLRWDFNHKSDYITIEKSGYWSKF